VFAIGLNYADHAAESGVDAPDFPPMFTKILSSLSGPDTDVAVEHTAEPAAVGH
jgi:2,4-diketo-3-deoxy-L-fuconate hydrolase